MQPFILYGRSAVKFYTGVYAQCTTVTFPVVQFTICLSTKLIFIAVSLLFRKRVDQTNDCIQIYEEDSVGLVTGFLFNTPITTCI